MRIGNHRFGAKRTPLELWDISPEWTVSGRKKVRKGACVLGSDAIGYLMDSK